MWKRAPKIGRYSTNCPQSDSVGIFPIVARERSDTMREKIAAHDDNSRFRFTPQLLERQLPQSHVRIFAAVWPRRMVVRIEVNIVNHDPALIGTCNPDAGERKQQRNDENADHGDAVAAGLGVAVAAGFGVADAAGVGVG